MMAEGNETTGGEPGRGTGPGGLGHDPPGRRSEGDLLAERRARRAAESGEVALTRRAEAAEATVLTLERHVASLQQRLAEAEEESLRIAELLELEKGAALEREHELRRVKQREYAEQQLRVEAEDRLSGVDRETRAESERIAARLGASEDDARELAERLEELERELAEAEQAAASDRAQVRRAELELGARLADLEVRAGQMQVVIEAERLARERSEGELLAVRRGHGQMEQLVAEMKTIVERLTHAVAVRPPPPPADASLAQEAPALRQPGDARGVDMAEALAAAVERLRARAEATPLEGSPHPPSHPAPPAHKHSLSLIGRWRLRRKQRRSR
jgi:DNA repair exonuclease SbcCD ATPase subunit